MLKTINQNEKILKNFINYCKSRNTNINLLSDNSYCFIKFIEFLHETQLIFLIWSLKACVIYSANTFSDNELEEITRIKYELNEKDIFHHYKLIANEICKYIIQKEINQLPF